MYDSKHNLGPQPNQNGWYANPTGAVGSGAWQGRTGAPHRPSTPETAIVQVTPQQPPERPPVSRATKKRGVSAVLVAAMLIVSLIGGALGGGAVTWHMNRGAATVAQVAEATPPAIAQPLAIPTPDAPAYPMLSTFDVTYAVDKAAASVVEIALSTRVRTFFGGERDSQSAGSGVVLTHDGYIVTNHHVIESGGEITVRLNDGREFPAELVGSDVRTDLAVLKIDADSLVPATITDSATVRVGQIAVAIGNPLGALGGTVTHGIVSALDREITIDGQEMTLLQTSAAVNPGNSGGGLFNAGGELIGVVNAKSTGVAVEGLGFAIPADIVRTVTNDLINHGYVTGRPELGIQVVRIADSRAAAYHQVGDAFEARGQGVFIVRVTRDNGLQPRDRILAIDGGQIESVDQVSDAVRGRSVGDVMHVTVLRNGQVLELEVTVGEQVPEHIRQNLPAPSDM